MAEKIRATVQEIKIISERLRIFRLVWEGIENFNFKAGQFVMLSSDDFLDEGNKPVKRAYSIVNAEHEKSYLELCISKQQYFSKFLFEEIKEGDVLNLEGPFGTFLLEGCEQNITFIAGGTGIAPMVSFIRTLRREGCDKDIWLFYSTRKEEDMAYRKEFEEYAKENKKFHYIPSCTRACENWKGRRERVTEFLHEYITTDRPCYICGPPAMDQAVKDKLREIGVSEKNIHAEKWG